MDRRKAVGDDSAWAGTCHRLGSAHGNTAKSLVHTNQSRRELEKNIPFAQPGRLRSMMLAP